MIKINELVNFQMNLDLSQYHILNSQKKDQDKYELYGIVNHYGNCGGGHYTAFAKNFLDKKWYVFDDSDVQPIKESQLVTKAAYLLFYQKIN